MGYLRFFLSMFKFSLIIQRRYAFELATGLIYMLLFLVFTQLGIHSFTTASAISDKLSMLIIGFFSFMLINNAISVVAYAIIDSSVTGTLEQAMLSPYGAEGVFLSVAITRSMTNFVITLILIPISMLICNHWFRINFLNLLIVVIPMWLSCWGIGFMIGSLALMFKRIQSFMALTQFLALYLIILPTYPFGVLSLLPIAPQAATLQQLVGLNLQFPWHWFIYLYINGICYLIFGLLTFKGGECYAKQKGLLGQY